jgi:hypothetical protein
MAKTTFSGPVESLNGFIGAFSSTSIELQSDNANKITLDAPNSLAADYTLIFPPNDGNSGQVLTTDGSGVTTWTTNGVGTVTSVDTTGTVNGLTLTGGPITASGTVTLGGTLDLSSPPAIGATAPAAGTFTTLTVNDSLVGAIQSLTDAGAVNITDPITALTTTGAAAITLADGAAGQLKIITMVVDGGDATLTPATPLGFATITFNDVGDGVTLVYTAAGWVIVGNNGATVA